MTKNSRLPIAAILIFLTLAANAETPKPSGSSGADKVFAGLSLREKIAQLIQIRVPGKFISRRSPDFQAISDQIRRNHVGGLVLFAGNVYESAILLNELQSISKLPLLVSADFERGASFRIADTTSFPWTMALGAAGSESLAYQEGLVTAQEARALGVHWIFAPVMDVNSNPDNPVINIRSFGEDPALVARLGSAFIRGAKKGGVLTTAKHFPGHGDTSTDSHLGLPVVNSDMARLQSVEFLPFKSAIEAGVDAVMTAHIAVPKVTGEPELPATLSSKIMTDILRNDLKFRGLMVTDALEMAGIRDRYWCGLAAVRAIQAGADVLLLPPDVDVVIREIERAVRRGDISQARIEQSARKILNVKLKMGLQQQRLVPIRRIGELVSSPRSIGLARDIADHSVTAIKDERHLLPANPAEETRIFSLVLSPDLESSPGAAFQAEMRRRFPDVRTMWANARIPDDLAETIDRIISGSDLLVCAIMARLSSGQDASSIPESQKAILEKLAASQKPLIWVALGSPYVFREIPAIKTGLCSFSYADVSQVAAAKALSGAIAISGRMPVSIPGLSKVGDGVQIPMLEMTLKPALSPDAFDETRRLLTSSIEAGAISGAQLAVGYQGRMALELAAGRTGDSAEAAAVSPETLYDLSSLSHIVRTASAAMLAKEAGCLIPGAPVTDYVPEIKDPGRGKLTVQELLRTFSDSPDSDPEGIEANAGLVEEIISRATASAPPRLLAGRLFEPLGMKSTRCEISKGSHSGVAGFRSPTRYPLFSNARDLAVFAQMLLNRGIYNHRRYFSPASVAKFTGPQGPWKKTSDSDWTGKVFSSSSFGYSSPDGSFFWIDPAKKLFVILLTHARRTSGEDARMDAIQQKLSESIVEVLNH